MNPNSVKAFSCVQLLNANFEDQAYTLLQNTHDRRKSLEEGVHRSNGQMTPSLENILNKIFNLRSTQLSIFPRNREQILNAIARDPIARRLSTASKSKMIRLVFHGHTRPYMAFLIARYMEESENRQGHLSRDLMFRIEMIVLLYTIEWTVRSLLKNRLNDLNEREKQEIINALRNPGRHRYPRGLNYNNPDGRVGFESLFIGYLKEREAWLANTNIFSLGDSIFE